MSEVSERLKLARERSGYDTAKAAAEAMGAAVATYIQHENGTRGFPAAKAQRYARFFRVAPEWLLYGKESADTVVSLGPQLYVIGEVQAGVFSEAWRRDRSKWEAFTGRPGLSIPAGQRFGLEVVGDSMNLLYPPGSILECAEYQGQELQTGRRVIVQRTRADGELETTVKEFVRGDDGVEWLVPRSSNPTHQAFRADRPDSPNILSVEIIGVVIASIRPE